jgi:hypothetical protein
VFDGGAFGNGAPVVGITPTAPIHGDRALKPRKVLFSTAGLPKALRGRLTHALRHPLLRRRFPRRRRLPRMQCLRSRLTARSIEIPV